MADIEEDDTLESLWSSEFGVLLFNLYTQDRKLPTHLYFSARRRIVLAMLRAMQDTERSFFESKRVTAP